MANLYKKITLNNGLRVITIPMENASSVTVLILVGTGSKYETKDINGISHFLEHMFFKGTAKRPNTLKISETLDSVGGQYNAFTSKEVTGFWAKVDKKHFDVALDWIFDIFLNSKFDEKEMEREKGVIIEEVNMYLDTPTAYIGELWEKLLYGDQPAGWMVIGQKENILSFNRKKVVDYYKSHYSSSNVIVCVAGAITPEKTEEKIKKYFQNTEKSKESQKVKVKEKQSEPQILLHYKKTDQTHFCLGVRAYDLFDERIYALALLSVILGGNMSSRLFIKVRERNGLAYSIHTSADNATDTGYLVTQAGIDHKNLEKSIELILQEYKDIKDNKITEKELQKAKDYLKGTTSLSLDSSDSQASFYAIQELLEKNILTPDEKFKKIDKVSVDDIKKISEDIFLPEKLNLAVIGPFEEKGQRKIEATAKTLKMSKEQVLDISWGTIFKIFVAIFIFYFIYLTREIALWFLFALAISVLLTPAIDFLKKLRIPKIIAVVLIYFSIFGVLGILIYLAAPIFISELRQLSQNLPDYFGQISPALQQMGIDTTKTFDNSTQLLMAALAQSSKGVVSAIMVFFGGLYSTAFILTAAFFLSLEDNAPEKFLTLVIPKKYEENIATLFQRAQSKISGWFGARILACIFVGVASFIIFYILGIKYAFILALISGILDFIPYIGQWITIAFLIAFIAVSSGSWLIVLYVVIAVLIIQEIESKLLTPLLMKKMVAVPPVLVLISLLVGAQVFGFLGTIFVVPVFGIIYEFIKEFLEKRREEAVEED